MKKGSLSGYDAETGEESAGSESSPGEPHEQPSLYRIRRTQEIHQFLRQDCRWRDRGRRRDPGRTRGLAAMGLGTTATLAGSNGSDLVQRLDLGHAEALRQAVGDGASRQDESHQRGQEEERYHRRPHHRRPGALQPAAGGAVRESAAGLHSTPVADPELAQRVARLMTISAVGVITALTWALEVGDPQRFPSCSDAMSYCGLTAALKSSAGKQQRGPISKQRNHWLQTTLIEAAKLAPRWNPQLAALHARELERGHRNRATLAVARKLVTYLLAVDKSGQAFQLRAPQEVPKQKAA